MGIFTYILILTLKRFQLAVATLFTDLQVLGMNFPCVSERHEVLSYTLRQATAVSENFST